MHAREALWHESQKTDISGNVRVEALAHAQGPDDTPARSTLSLQVCLDGGFIPSLADIKLLQHTLTLATYPRALALLRPSGKFQ